MTWACVWVWDTKKGGEIWKQEYFFSELVPTGCHTKDEVGYVYPENHSPLLVILYLKEKGSCDYTGEM